jgi:hypothetical protein
VPHARRAAALLLALTACVTPKAGGAHVAASPEPAPANDAAIVAAPVAAPAADAQDPPLVAQDSPADAQDAPVGAQDAPVGVQDSPRSAGDAGRTGTALSWPDKLPACAPEVQPLRKGLVAGSWAVREPADFERSYVDETALREVFTGQAAGRRAWHGFATATDIVPLDDLLSDREGPALGYVYSLLSRVAPPEGIADQAAVLHVRHLGRVQAWWDGRLVLDAQAPAFGAGDSRVAVPLTGPYDVLLLKLGRGPGLGASMDVSVRASAADGSPLPGQEWKTMRPPGLPTDLVPQNAGPAASGSAPAVPER